MQAMNVPSLSPLNQSSFAEARPYAPKLDDDHNYQRLRDLQVSRLKPIIAAHAEHAGSREGWQNLHNKAPLLSIACSLQDPFIYHLGGRGLVTATNRQECFMQVLRRHGGLELACLDEHRSRSRR